MRTTWTKCEASISLHQSHPLEVLGRQSHQQSGSLGRPSPVLQCLLAGYVQRRNSTTGDYQKANALFRDAKLQAVNHDLSEVVDEEGQVYSVEKFCYSNPSNMMVGRVEEETTVIAGKTISYHFRLQTVRFAGCSNPRHSRTSRRNSSCLSLHTRWSAASL